MIDFKNINNINNVTAKTFKTFAQPNADPQRYYFNSSDPEKSAKKKPKRLKDIMILGFGATSLLVGAAFIFLTTGSGAKASQRMKKGVQSLSYKISDKIGNSKSSIKLEKTMNKALKSTEKALNISANFTPLKDLGFRKFSFKLPDCVGKKPWQKITDLFSKINISTTQKKLLKANNNVNQILDWIEFNAEKFSPEAKKQLQEQAQNLQDLKVSYFGKFGQRVQEMDDIIRPMSDKLTLKQIIEGMKDGLVTETLLKKDKEKYFAKIEKNIKKMTNNIPKICGEIELPINKSKEIMFDIKDEGLQSSVRTHLKKLSQTLSDYKKAGFDTRKVKEGEFTEALASYKKFLEGKLNEENNDISKLLKNCENISNVFDSISKGETKGIIEDMRLLVGRYDSLNQVDKDQFRKICKKATKDLDEALKGEINMFDKDREIVIGSAPTDLLGMAAPFVLLGSKLAGDKNSKEEKVGMTLQAGIPLVGGVGTYLYGMAKQFSGVQSLIVSFGLGAVLNSIGSAVFKVYQKKNHSQQNPESKINKN